MFADQVGEYGRGEGARRDEGWAEGRRGRGEAYSSVSHATFTLSMQSVLPMAPS